MKEELIDILVGFVLGLLSGIVLLCLLNAVWRDSPMWILVIPLLVVGFYLYGWFNQLNPNSIFCIYQIYKQPDGTYQVWAEIRTKICELKGATYEEAKAFQIKECRELKDFIWQKPKGEKVK